MYEVIEHISDEYIYAIKKINSLDYSSFTSSELDKEIANIKKDLIALSPVPGRTLREAPEASFKVYSLVKEFFRREMDINIFDEQIHAALVLAEGTAAQMQTGEGKTFAAAFPAVLNALSGIHTDIYTFNDYLAERDALWLSPIYGAFNITVGHIFEKQGRADRANAYECDITYMTAKESGFDYLREFTAESPDELYIRNYDFAIVDEADSILIDEARIPLVIAESMDQTSEEDLVSINDLVQAMTAGVEYIVDRQDNNVYLSEDGITFSEKGLGIDNLYSEENLQTLVSINNALYARELVRKDVDYIVKDESIKLVDEFTGRVASKRHWPHGLHEAIEIKEGIKLSNKGRILSQITLQNYMRLYKVISGMTGTAVQAAEELDNTYDLKVHVIPTHKKKIRIDRTDKVYYDKGSKIKAIIETIKKEHSTGRPILIGTGSVEESEIISGYLEDEEIECNVLNAKNDEMEARLIAEAGDLFAVTVSTNMAGRGIDIKLGGTKENNYDKVKSLGGLLVIGTNRHESTRVDSQLRGRAGRQGDPGESQFFVSIKDDIFLKYNFNELVPPKLIGDEHTGRITNEKILKETDRLQRIVQGMNFDIRASLSKYTVILQEQSEYIRNTRRNILLADKTCSPFMEEFFPNKFIYLSDTYGREHVCDCEKLICLRIINDEWAEYLENMSYVKDSIHIMKMSGKDPLLEYNRVLFDSFKQLKDNIYQRTLQTLEDVEIDENGPDADAFGLSKPSSTWTYIISNSAEQLQLFPFLDSLAKTIKRGL